MSLQHLAEQIQSKGRGKDSMLVHMSPKEVNSLQELAMAHGGSLSVNPNTGLPEAGFLDNLLPTIIGGAAMAATGGAAAGIAPWMVGLGVGGIEALRTGDLGKGLMAGLGAYGGAGMMGGLIGAGASQMGEATAQQMAGGLEGASAAELNAARAGAAQNIAQTSPWSAAGEGVKSIFNHPEGIKAGLSNVAQNMGGTMPALGQVAAAAAPVLTAQPETQTFQAAKTDEIPQYTYSPGAVTPTPQPNVPGYTDYRNYQPGQPSGMAQNFGREQQYYSPQFTFQGMKTIPKDQAQPQPQKSNGLLGLGFLGLAGGGLPVEEMSKQASVGANTGYPQSGIKQGVYATPWQSPYATDVVGSAADVNVNPMTGEMRMASGGALAVETPTITGKPVEEKLTGVDGGYDGWENPNPTVATPAELAAINNGLTALALMAVPGMMTMDMALNGGQLSAQAFGGNFSGQQAPAPVVDASAPVGGSASGSGEDAGIGSGAAIGDNGELAAGGIASLGSYSAGGRGRLLRGPGDGVSDNIPAVIGKNQPARLADGEFVVPARIVSELGNGSTEAGARKLYAMMDRIQAGRKKTMGKGKQFANDSKAEKHLPA